jgi:ABC-type nitrate/sulfonate/bicarbonate transport system substrate-binding protein
VPRASSRRRNRKSRYRGLGLVLLIGAVCLGAAAILIREELPALRSRPAADKSTVLYLDGAFGPRFAGEMIAQKQGYFVQVGQTINLQPNPDTADFAETVAREHAIGVTTAQKFLLAAWRGVPVIAFGASFLDTPTAIFTLARSGLRRPVDLVGKRLAYRPGEEGEVIFDAMMAQLGLPRSQIRKIPTQDGFRALRAGDVDAVVAAIGDQPSPEDPDSPELNVIKPQDYAIHVPGLVYFASAALVRDYPSVIDRTLRGIIRGWQAAYADYGISAPLIAQFDAARLTPAHVQFVLQQQRELVRPPDTRIADYDASRWRTLRDILIFAKLGEETVGLPAVVNHQFVRDIYRRAPDLRAPGAWGVGMEGRGPGPEEGPTGK